MAKRSGRKGIEFTKGYRRRKRFFNWFHEFVTFGLILSVALLMWSLIFLFEGLIK